MRLEEARQLLDRGRRRHCLVGDRQAGILVTLDLEGRLFAVRAGEIIHRLNPAAFLEVTSDAGGYLNPGGDALWPAPEGTIFGYLYAAGAWRVPPGVTGARYRLAAEGPGRATIRAEVDLVNNLGLGLPSLFEREFAVSAGEGFLRLEAVESITALGACPPGPGRFRLAPWTLAQFDCGPGCRVLLPPVPAEEISDFYGPSDDCRSRDDSGWRVMTEGARRFQVGLGASAGWLEFQDPGRGLRVRREVVPPGPGLAFIDIADRPPDRPPAAAGTRLSVYNDAGGFMEIEAAGGSPTDFPPGTKTALAVTTTFYFGPTAATV